MKRMFTIIGCLTAFAVLFTYIGALAQPERGFDPTQMAEDEKLEVLEKVTNLNDDQKLILDQIYKDFASGIENLFKNRTEDRELMRAKRQELSEAKKQAIRDLFTEEQYAIYEEITTNRFQRRRNNNQ